METVQYLHERAILCAKHFKRAEAELLEILQRVDDRKVFRAMGYPSLFAYAVSALKLSESLAYQFIGVARKSKEVPQLKTAIESGEITVSTARRVVSVINKANQADWIHKAKSLTQKTLEMEVAKENPKGYINERIRPVAEERLEMRLGIAPNLEKKLSRIKDLLSQKAKKSVSLEESLEAMADVFLEKHDPVQRAERQLARKVAAERGSGSSRQPATCSQDGSSARPQDGSSAPQRHLPAKTVHAVNLRDRGQCTYVDSQGIRCNESRWTQKHHLKLFSHGGNHEPSNLQTLCFHHHRKVHEDLSRAHG